jgi:hypothetical protein
MNQNIMAVLRRAGLRLVRGNKPLQSLPNYGSLMGKSAKSLRRTISYQTLPSTEKADRKNHVRSSPDIISHNSGPPLALPPPATVASTSGIPNEYEFEILRLRRRVESLECTVRDRDERNVAAIAMLEVLAHLLTRSCGRDVCGYPAARGAYRVHLGRAQREREPDLSAARNPRRLAQNLTIFCHSGK